MQIDLSVRTHVYFINRCRPGRPVVDVKIDQDDDVWFCHSKTPLSNRCKQLETVRMKPFLHALSCEDPCISHQSRHLSILSWLKTGNARMLY